MSDDEEQQAADAMSNLLTSALMRAHDENRMWLHGWERRGLQWLMRFHDRRPDGLMCAWCHSFMMLNRDVILADKGPIDFNLRAARLLAKQSDQA